MCKMCLQLWLGDFNALTREDYTQKQWDAIASKRFKKLLGGAQNRGKPLLKRNNLLTFFISLLLLSICVVF